MRSAPITLLTDFGADVFVGVMKGVIFSIDPEARVIDLTHAVPPQDVLAAALALRASVPYFPPNTIHVAVVDPGVGSSRRPIFVETSRALLVGPDNGVLSLAATRLGRRQVRVIENQRYLREPVSQTFHGRDVFAPVAAHLSLGVSPQDVGPPADAMVELTLPPVQRTGSGVAGQVLYVDHFGNLVTNIESDAIPRVAHESVCVSIADRRVVGPVSAYAAVEEGEPLAIIGSWGMLEIAVRNGNAARTFAAGPGTPVTVVVESRDA